MECHLMGTASFCLENRLQQFLWQSRKSSFEKIHTSHYKVAAWTARMRFQRSFFSNLASTGKNSLSCSSWRTFSIPVSLDESSSPELEEYNSDDEDAPGELLEKPLSSDELKALLVDSERERLIKKLSEANQQNRFLKRQLYDKEGALVNFKSELAVTELEVQALVALAEEIANYGIPEGSRKINGKYIQSHLHSRLEAVHKKLKEQIKDVEAAKSKEVHLFWRGMAEVHLHDYVKLP